MVAPCGERQQEKTGDQVVLLLIPRESRELVEALLSDADLQQILIRLQARVQPYERKQRPPAEEHEHEEDRSVNPQPADQIPERSEGKRPPVEAQSRRERLVVQGRHGVFLA